MFSSSNVVNDNLAYIDKAYQLCILSTVPITLTFLKNKDTENIYNSIKKYSPIIFIFLIINFLIKNNINLQLSAYINLTIGLVYISILGHGLAVNKKQINYQNYTIFISTIISGGFMYFQKDYFYEVIFIHVFLNMLIRNFILSKV